LAKKEGTMQQAWGDPTGLPGVPPTEGGTIKLSLLQPSPSERQRQVYGGTN